MKILVGYDGSDLSERALAMAREHARAFNAKIYVLHSILSDWPKEEYEQQKRDMEKVRSALEKESFASETFLNIANQMPGEHLVQFAEENDIDEIIIGVKTRSKVGKLLLGSVAQFVILKAPCVVVTVK